MTCSHLKLLLLADRKRIELSILIIMRKSVLIVMLAFLSSYVLMSQELPECGSTIVQESEIEDNTLFQRRLFNLESRLIVGRTNGMELRDGEICVIPVVVHVLHVGENIGNGSNISDAQVQSALVALNEDFRKIAGTNGDGNGADVGIEFCLALRDPDGNSTNGIIRSDASSIPSYLDEGIGVGQGSGADEVTVKSFSVWPKDDYLNIWIVNEIEDNDGGSGIQGFAYFPFNSVKDGVTLLHNSFGTIGNLKNYTDMNRTTSHEVGHFLGLYHTFQNSTDCDETNCESQGDRVCDTPVTVINSSCSSPECSGTQQIENYMDYTGQTCKNMFTEGQKVRMRFTLFEERGSLLESLGCVPVSEYDASVSSVNYPTGSLCSGNIFPEVTITNYGGQDLTSLEIQHSVDNGAIESFDWSGNLAPGASELVTLPLVSVGSGTHIFYANSASPNGGSDEYSSNDAAQSGFSLSSGVIATVNINIDYAGSETTWAIIQEGDVLSSGGPYIDNNPGVIMTHNVCLSEDCYEFVIYDEYGDGLGFLVGDYEVLDGSGNQVAFGQNNFGDSASHEFCLEAPVGDPPSSSFTASTEAICMDESVNFNSTSLGDPSGWSWQFEGGTPSTSSSENPQNIQYTNPGNYSVTLTTTNTFGADVETIDQMITVQASPDIAVTSSDILCNGANDGAASVTASSGSSILWSTGGTENQTTNLSANSYSVTATSSIGCASSVNFTISEPQELSLTVLKSDITCFGAADGTASATVNGGTSAYNYSWSSGSNSITGLDEGVYSLLVSDANGCETSAEFAVVQPSEIVVTVNDILAETCEGFDGSAIANGLGGTGNLTYSWSNETNGQTLSGVSFGDYEVIVSDDSGCSTQTEFSIPYDCAEVLPTTQLVSNQCNKSGFALSEELRCNSVPGVEMYLWNFTDAAGVILDEAYTMGNNNNFMLSELDFLTYGSSFNVKIKIQKESEWGEWGGTCSVNILETPPAVSITEADCNTEYVTLGYTLQAEPNTGADEFEWFIHAESGSHNYFTYVNQITITQEMSLTPNDVFSVQVRARHGEAWSEYGDECTFTLEVVDNILSWDDQQEILISVYPNPNSGNEFSIDLENLTATNNVLDISVYDSSGRFIKTWSEEQNRNTHISKTYSFDDRLSSGMYLIQVDSAGQMYQQKLIVK